MFTALPMFLAECYVVSEILLLLKGAKQCPRLKAFNKASAYASAVVILVLAFIAGFSIRISIRGWLVFVLFSAVSNWLD